ncbi:hypothetical protein [Corynebacterium sp. CCM 9204]|uniref:hypothetical protein n=1 Tax=Corynebacterium sp. CCM 9204 TaxID=3057616 RepID=UPI003523260B
MSTINRSLAAFAAVVMALLIAVSPALAEDSAPVKNGEKFAATMESCEEFIGKADAFIQGEDIANKGGLAGNITKGLRYVECGALAAAAHPVDAAKGAKDKVSGFWNDPIGKFTRALMEGNTETMQSVMTFWMSYSSTSLGGTDVGENIEGVRNIVLAVAGFALIASFIVGGARLAASRRSGLQDGLEDMGEVIGRWLIFSACIPVIVPGALMASDIVADEIMKQFGATSPETFVNLTSLEGTPYGPVVMLLLAGISLAGSVMQLVALVVRVLVLPLAVGLAPLFAALSFTDTGRNGLNHLVAYMIAAIAFKPVSALLYAVVLWNVSRTGTDGSLGGDRHGGD